MTAEDLKAYVLKHTFFSKGDADPSGSMENVFRASSNVLAHEVAHFALNANVVHFKLGVQTQLNSALG